MFKSAATKIAHNSTLPSLGGNQDLRPLQDLITAEKTVLISLQKLSVDYAKAAEALRTWGLSEGDDLGDVLSASTNVLNHFSTALSQYAGHGHTMRDQLKAIRTREEALDDLKRRRRTVLRKADDAEKKLSKMSPEHKNLAMQTELLQRLQSEIRQMDSDILLEEASLGDFKRTATKVFMGLKFGGLLECCEKGTISAELGKHIIAEVSEEPTQPGLPRGMYYGHQKVESYVSEAYQRINEVALSTVASQGFRDRLRAPPPQGGFPPAFGNQLPAAPWSPVENKPQPPPPIMTDGDFSDGDFSAPPRASAGDLPSPPQGNGSAFSTQSLGGRYQDPSSANNMKGTGSAFSPSRHEHQTTDDFGVRSAGPSLDSPTSGGGRFATFPVKMRSPGSAGGFTLSDPPSLSSRDDPGESFSASIAQALGDKSPLGTEHTSAPWTSVSVNDTTGPQSLNQGAEGTTTPTEDGMSRLKGTGSPTSSSFAPSLPPIVLRTSSESQPPPSDVSGSGLPPGAAAPDPWAPSAKRDAPSLQTPSTHNRQASGGDALLAYMLTADDTDPEEEVPSPAPTQTTIPIIDSRLHVEETEEQRLSRHVRFGQVVEDVNEELENRNSLENARKSQEGEQATLVQPVQTPSPSGTSPEPPKRSLDDSSISPKQEEVPAVKEQDKHTPEETPSPPQDEERALNAAAAREITLELEALKGNPPVPEKTFIPSPQVPSSLISGTPSHINNLNTSGYDDRTFERGHSPLSPPQPLFSKRAVSPHPYAELNTNTSPYSQYSTQQPEIQAPYQQSPPYSRQSQLAQVLSPAQAYAQAYQNSAHPNSPPQQQEYLPPVNNLPPRLQALNNNPPDNQVPPRFQNLNGGRPGMNNIPPRFQMGGPAQVPAAMTPESDPPLSPPNADFSRPLGSLQFNNSNTSLNGGNIPISPLIPGARTISAAAFKRPVKGATGEVPLGEPLRKTLPTSPREPFIGSPPSRDQAMPGSPPARDQPALTQSPPQYQQPLAQYQQVPSQYQRPDSQYQSPLSQYQALPAQFQPPASQFQPPASQFQPPPSQFQPPTQHQTPQSQQIPSQYQQYPTQFQQPPSQYKTSLATQHQELPQLREPTQRQPPLHLQDQRPVSEFEEYDYISAYVNNSNPNSPLQGEFQQPGPAPPHHEPGGGYPQQGYPQQGYQQQGYQQQQQGYRDNRYPQGAEGGLR